MASLGDVCVTGANGFIASWLVKMLLEKGYTVHGTVRNPNDSRHAHLWNLPKASTHLRLFAADLNDSASFDDAIRGCVGLFHTASPVEFGSREQVVPPAINGTIAVLDAAVRAGSVTRVVLTSSMVAIQPLHEAHVDEHKVYSEADWMDTDMLEATKQWYQLSKTLAERAAWEHQKRNENQYSLVVINPTYVAGPRLQDSVNFSSNVVRSFISGEMKEIANDQYGFVDVRDCAEMHINAYEQRNATGRHVCLAISTDAEYTAAVLRKVAPEFSAHIPTRMAAGEHTTPLTIDNCKGEALLGHPFIGMEEIMRESVRSLQASGSI